MLVVSLIGIVKRGGPAKFLAVEEVLNRFASAHPVVPVCSSKSLLCCHTARVRKQGESLGF